MNKIVQKKWKRTNKTQWKDTESYSSFSGRLISYIWKRVAVQSKHFWLNEPFKGTNVQPTEHKYTALSPQISDTNIDSLSSLLWDLLIAFLYEWQFVFTDARGCYFSSHNDSTVPAGELSRPVSPVEPRHDSNGCHPAVMMIHAQLLPVHGFSLTKADCLTCETYISIICPITQFLKELAEQIMGEGGERCGPRDEGWIPNLKYTFICIYLNL